MGTDEEILATLAEATARYLASDGSFGLYDAGAYIQARADIQRIVSPELITKAQSLIRQKSSPSESSAKSAVKSFP